LINIVILYIKRISIMRVRDKGIVKEEEIGKNSSRGRPQSHRMESNRKKEFKNGED